MGIKAIIRQNTNNSEIQQNRNILCIYSSIFLTFIKHSKIEIKHRKYPLFCVDDA